MVPVLLLLQSVQPAPCFQSVLSDQRAPAQYWQHRAILGAPGDRYFLPALLAPAPYCRHLVAPLDRYFLPAPPVQAHHCLDLAGLADPASPHLAGPLVPADQVGPATQYCKQSGRL